MNNRFEKFQLLLARTIPSLAQQSRELQGFTDRGKRLENNEPLAVPSRAPKGKGKLTTINQNGTVKNTFSFAVRQYIEQSGLSSIG
ncbi:hypothetical protein N7533_006487 [Penicillium manginii]|jgi:hypothetical protein|uniref:uncharacterized protein n=1 Tax=Penicillium manginii TaxID=203109 RepID=UPI002546AEEE|nr:uncharacterized protein N7533_006487 [Penicillium manginii]KAJ5749459.1 hypothetical protein N7533_006487 [Penicillium manginii]